jgi:hypothetical protein
MKKSTSFFAQIAVIAITGSMMAVSSCQKSESVLTPAPPGNEFLTTVVLQCINTKAPYDTETCLWRDLTPNGSNPPDTSEAILNLAHGSVYACNVYILDESQQKLKSNLMDTNHFNINKLPANDSTANVTTEIRARQNYHLVCFTMTQGTGGGLAANLSVVRDDYDNNSPPLQVGLIDTFTSTGVVSNGRMEVVLHHQPNVKNGSCEPGSPDFDVFYTVNIK